MKIFTTYCLWLSGLMLIAAAPSHDLTMEPLISRASMDSGWKSYPPGLQLTVHGNPVKRVLRFEVLSDGKHKNSIYLTNLLGRNVLDINVPKKESRNKEFYEVELDLDIPAGIYTLIVESGEERVVKRLQIL